MKHRIIIAIGIVVFVGAFIWWHASSSPARESVHIMDRFDDKIVYTTDMSLERTPLKAHCTEFGGLFNECGSPCPSDTDEVCAEVCAYTCEDL